MSVTGTYSLILDYPTSAVNEPRWGYGKLAHPLLYEIFNRGRQAYASLLTSFLDFKEQYALIPVNEIEIDPKEPYLSNLWFPGLDSLTLYCLLAMRKPKRYIEIGSGHSTKFARRSIHDNRLNTRLISIDPEPRAEINALCDEVHRQSLEQLDISLFEQLEDGDFLFFDGSHRCFMNSDVTVFFLEILPRLKPGIVVQIHDIFLPNDYPSEWIERYYNEQYLLAACLLSGCSRFDILLPNAFVSGDPHLFSIVAPVFSSPEMEQVIKGGGSFWLVTQGNPMSSIHHKEDSLTNTPVAQDDELANMSRRIAQLEAEKQSLLSDYTLARRTLIEISNSRAYHLLRYLGRWRWLQGVLAQLPDRR